jgi:integrase
VVSLGFDADGKRLRRKVSGQTKAEVKDKLKALHSKLGAGLRTAQGYTVEKAVTDWLDEGLPGRTARRSRRTGTRCGRCWRSSGGSR